MNKQDRKDLMEIENAFRRLSLPAGFRGGTQSASVRSAISYAHDAAVVLPLMRKLLWSIIDPGEPGAPPSWRRSDIEENKAILHEALNDLT